MLRCVSPPAAVHNAIVARIGGVTDCASVTAEQLAAITSLDLGSGIIALKADDFSGLSALTSLDLSNNQLSTLPAGAFTGLSALTELRLDRNQLSTLPAGAFTGLSALTELDLGENQLSALSAGAFTGLSVLTELYLHSNQLSTLPAGIFSDLSVLTELYLHSNQFSTLPAGTFNAPPVLNPGDNDGSGSKPLFRGGASSDGGETYFKDNAFSAGESLNIVFVITPRRSDTGEQVDVVVAARQASAPDTVVLLTPSGLVPWDGETLFFFKEDITLESNTFINLTPEEAIMLSSTEVGNWELFIGYQVADGEVLYHAEPLRIEVVL